MGTEEELSLRLVQGHSGVGERMRSGCWPSRGKAMTGLISYEDVLLGSGESRQLQARERVSSFCINCDCRVYIRAVFFFSCVHNCVSLSMFVLQKNPSPVSLTLTEGTCTQEGIRLSVMAGWHLFKLVTSSSLHRTLSEVDK